MTRWILGARSDRVASDGDALVLGDILFSVCPWWDGPVARAAVAAQLASDSTRSRRRWIWVHHAPPDRSPVSWGGSRYFGDVELVSLIEAYRPDIVFSGHVHQSPFTQGGSWVDRIGSTWVFNVGHQFGAPPAHIIFDSAEETAFWFSAAGNQVVRLDEPLTQPPRKLAEIPDWLIAEGRPVVRRPA
jgi:hypothetical protein